MQRPNVAAVYGCRMDPNVMTRDLYGAADDYCKCGPCQPDDGLCPMHRIAGVRADALPNSAWDTDRYAWWLARYDRQPESSAREERYWSGFALGAVYHLLDAYPEQKPRVGMGATLLYPSDRHPYTVVEVLSERRVRVRACSHEEGLPERIAGKEYEVSLRSDGRWRERGVEHPRTFALGYRDSYRPREA